MKYRLFYVNGNDVSCTTESRSLSTILDAAYQDSFIQKLYVRRTIIACGHRFEQDILVYDIYNSTIELKFPEPVDLSGVFAYLSKNLQRKTNLKWRDNE